jgi:hypothetical protein
VPANTAAEHEYLALELRRSSDQDNKEDGKPAAGFGPRIHALSSVGKTVSLEVRQGQRQSESTYKEG